MKANDATGLNGNDEMMLWWNDEMYKLEIDLGSLVHANDATGLNVNANDAVKCYLIYCLLFF